MDDFQLFTSLRYDPALLDVPNQGFSGVGWNQEPSPFYMLDLHRDRMLRAAVHWGWTPAVDLLTGDEGLRRLRTYLENITTPLGPVPHRVKIVLSRDGVLSHEKGPVPARPLTNFFPSHLPAPGDSSTTSGNPPTKDLQFEVAVDTRDTTKSAFTHFKTTSRDMYDGARARAVISLVDAREVLLFNDADGQIMEGSMTTPFFRRDGQWVTPPVPKKFVEGPGSGNSGGNDGTTRRWALERNMAVEKPILASDLVDGEECWISNGVRGFIFGKVKLSQ